MFDQAADPGMVYGLRRRSGPVPYCDGFIREDRFQQLLQVWIGKFGDQTLQLAKHFLAVALGRGQKIRDVDFRLHHRL